MIIKNKLTHLLLMGVSPILLFGCNNDASDSLQDGSTIEEGYENEDNSNDEESNSDSEEIINDEAPSDEESTDTEQVADEQPDGTSLAEENDELLSEYSNEEIEYARVWLLLGPNQEIDELNVHLIPAGTAINPNDETSAVYPEEVIQLTGSRLVDGSVTYSGNGEGTINIYNVPLRWETTTPDELDENYMREHTESIIEDTETVYVDPGSENEIIELIEIMNLD